MDVCLSLIQDALSLPSRCVNASSDPLIDHCEFFYEGKHLEQGVLYLARAEELAGAREGCPDAPFLCIGEPADPSPVSSSPLLILDETSCIFHVSDELGSIFRTYRALEERLHESVESGCSLQGLTNIIAPFFINDISIANANHYELARYPETPPREGEPDGGGEVSKEAIPVEIIEFFTNNKRWVDVKTETEPFIYDEGIFDERLLCMNIFRGEEFDWRVSIVENKVPFRPYDGFLLKFFAGFVSKVHDRMVAGEATQAIHMLANSVISLLLGKKVEPLRIGNELSVIAHEKEAKFLCLYLRPSSWDNSDETASYYCDYMNRQFAGVSALPYENHIVCLANIAHYQYSVNTFLTYITPFLRDGNFRSGVSEAFKDILRLKDHYRQAEIALDYGLAKSPTQWTHRFGEHMVSYVVQAAGEKTGLRALCSEKIHVLHEYDKANGSSYLETVECYFGNSLNTVKTAAALNIHRATMVYRLKRIQELSGIDFQSAHKNLFYQLSIEALKCLDQGAGA